MTVLRDWTAANRVAAAVLAVTLASLLAVGLDAALLDPLPIPDGTVPAAARGEEPDLRLPASWTPLILGTVASNPMRPDRRRAEGRYGQRDVASEVETEPPAAIPEFRLVGIVESRVGSDFAALALGRRPSALVRQGDTIGGFTLRLVRTDSIFLARPDTVLGLPAPGANYTTGGR